MAQALIVSRLVFVHQWEILIHHNAMHTVLLMKDICAALLCGMSARWHVEPKFQPLFAKPDNRRMLSLTNCMGWLLLSFVPACKSVNPHNICRCCFSIPSKQHQCLVFVRGGYAHVQIESLHNCSHPCIPIVLNISLFKQVLRDVDVVIDHFCFCMNVGFRAAGWVMIWLRQQMDICHKVGTFLSQMVFVSNATPNDSTVNIDSFGLFKNTQPEFQTNWKEHMIFGELWLKIFRLKTRCKFLKF